MPKNNFYLIFGLVIFYFLSFVSPSKIIYTFSYAAGFFLFYLSTGNFVKSLFYVLILSLFTDFGLAKSIFLLEPPDYNLGSGWSISPMSIALLLLVPSSLLKKFKNVRPADILIIIFLFSALFSFIFFPGLNGLLGMVSLAEVIVCYFIIRIHLNIQDNNIIRLIVSLFIFQGVLSGLQFFFQRPLGQVVEGVINNNPYGLVTPEDAGLFRVTGSFTHPNFLASFILATYPFILLSPFKGKLFSFLKIIGPAALIFTYSRASWIIMTALGSVMFITKKVEIWIRHGNPNKFILMPAVLISFLLLFGPYLISRLNSFSIAFESSGSMDVRFKTYAEALGLISQYPITGVGLYQSVIEYVRNPVTDLFDQRSIGRFYGIHNTPLEIMAEIGMPGFLFFAFFLFSVLLHYFKSNKSYLKDAAFYGLLGLIGISMFNPFFHTSQFRIFFLLSAIVLA